MLGQAQTRQGGTPLSSSDDLIKHIEAAIASLRSSGTYRAGEHDWAVATERNRGILTGNVIAICNHSDVLSATEARLRQRGHGVVRNDNRNALIVTPAA